MKPCTRVLMDMIRRLEGDFCEELSQRRGWTGTKRGVSGTGDTNAGVPDFSIFAERFQRVLP